MRRFLVDLRAAGAEQHIALQPVEHLGGLLARRVVGRFLRRLRAVGKLIEPRGKRAIGLLEVALGARQHRALALELGGFFLERARGRFSRSGDLASALAASSARCTRDPSQVPTPAPTTAPIGPAGKPADHRPGDEPRRLLRRGLLRCRVSHRAESAHAAALTPTKPMVQISFDCAIFMTLLLCCGHSRAAIAAS